MRFSRSIRIAVVAMAAAAIGLVPAAGALGGGPPVITVTVESTEERTSPVFSFESAQWWCDEPDHWVEDEAGEEVDASITVVEPEGQDDWSGEIDMGDLPAGTYTLFVEANCDGIEMAGSEDFSFARLTVTKDVAGDAPEEAVFAVEVDCEGTDEADETFVEEPDFPAAGGSQQVAIYAATECTVTETEDGGADSTEIDNGTTDFNDEPADLETTVTNLFAADEEVDDEAEPAEPVEAEPTFTG